MKTALVAAAACLGISATAAAGPYVGIALGTAPSINDDFVASVGSPSSRGIRALGGYRFSSFAIGTLSLEGSLNGFGIMTRAGSGETLYSLSLAGKFSLPLGNDFEAFGRLGIERTWLNLGGDNMDMTGNGILAAAGFEFHLDMWLPKASVFVDYTIRHVSLDETQYQSDLTTGAWGLGFTYGF